MGLGLWEKPSFIKLCRVVPSGVVCSLETNVHNIGVRREISLKISRLLVLLAHLFCMFLEIHRLECLPYTFRKLTNLKALWLSENQVMQTIISGHLRHPLVSRTLLTFLCLILVQAHGSAAVWFRSSNSVTCVNLLHVSTAASYWWRYICLV